MPLTIDLLGTRGRRAGTQEEEQRRYSVSGTDDFSVALSAVSDHVPGYLRGMEIESFGGFEQIQNGWEMEVRWATNTYRPPPQEGESQFNFEVATLPVRVLLPLGPIQSYAAPGKPAFIPKLIGESGRGTEPEGCEILEPVYEESETHWISALLIDDYKAGAKSVVGCTNTGVFRGHAPGEVLMKGVSGARHGRNDWEMTFRWSVKPNQTGLTFGDVTGVSRKGWQYLWPVTVDRAGNSAGPLEIGITHVCVADVFPSRNFGLLGI